MTSLLIKLSISIKIGVIKRYGVCFVSFQIVDRICRQSSWASWEVCSHRRRRRRRRRDKTVSSRRRRRCVGLLGIINALLVVCGQALRPPLPPRYWRSSLRGHKHDADTIVYRSWWLCTWHYWLYVRTERRACNKCRSNNHEKFIWRPLGDQRLTWRNLINSSQNGCI